MIKYGQRTRSISGAYYLNIGVCKWWLIQKLIELLSKSFYKDLACFSLLDDLQFYSIFAKFSILISAGVIWNEFTVIFYVFYWFRSLDFDRDAGLYIFYY